MRFNFLTQRAPVWRLASLLLVLVLLPSCADAELSERERRLLASLSLSALPAPTQISNRYFTNPDAQQLGNLLFHDPQLSQTQSMSCATCHAADKYFADGLETPVDNTLGNGTVNRNTPTVVGSAWNTWQYWDGRRDSLWSQALTPLEAPVEMASNRVAIARYILLSDSYRARYQTVFGPFPLTEADLSVDASPVGNQAQKRAWFDIELPIQFKINTVFANIGKAMGAFQGTLEPPASRFDKFVEKLNNNEDTAGILSKEEIAGARLFINEKKTQCLECHNGPLLSNGNFHSIGTGNLTGEQKDLGRAFGAQAVLQNEFNCHGRYSDARPEDCKHLNFMNRDNITHSQGAFKTPSLRNISNTGPYFHDGRFATLAEVLLHYNDPPTDKTNHDLRNFKLTDKEMENLSAFLHALSAEP